MKQQLALALSATRNLPFESEEIEVAVEDFLRRVREHTGILVERAPRQYGFLHLTFEEYFAAREIIRRRVDALQKIHQHRHDPRWEEPVLLAVAFVSNDYPEDATEMIVTAILAEGEDAEAMGFESSLYEEVLHCSGPKNLDSFLVILRGTRLGLSKLPSSLKLSGSQIP